MGGFSIWHWFIVILIIGVAFAPLWIGLLIMGGQKTVSLQHRESGLVKKGYYGYCWTYLLFGFFVPVFRGELGIGALHLVFSVITGGIFQLIMPYLYNKQFTSRLLTSGWSVAGRDELDVHVRQRLGLAT